MKLFKYILNNKEYIKHLFLYLLFGVLTTVVSLGLFWLLREYAPFINENVSNALSIISGIIFAYFTNRKYVFSSIEKNMLKEFSKFFASRAFTFFFDMFTFFIFASLLKYNEMIVKICIAVAVVILNYIFSKILVFNKK